MRAPATGRRILSRRLRLLLPLLMVVLLLGIPALASAHPLGNFSINRYSRLEVGAEQVELFYVVDMAEIPTFQVMPEVDTNGDGTIGDAEKEQYLDAQLAILQPNLRLTVNGAALPLDLQERALEFPDGQGGLQTTHLTARFAAALPASEVWQADYRDDNYADRLGWQEIIVRSEAGASLLESSVPSEDITQELRDYPQDLLQSPLAVNQATFRFEPGASAQTNSAATAAAPAGARAEDPFAALISSRPVGGTALILVLVAAFGWGAAHALSPGHGKTIVAAYLVGSKGTAKHALFLGLTTTITHTAGVFALGFVTLFLSRFILPEQLYPWLGVLSGLLVVSIGASLFNQRLRSLREPHAAHHHHHHDDHDHDHDHAHDHSHDHEHDHHHDHGHVHSHGGHTHSHMPPGANGEPVTWKSLLALGISGGLLPCPSALVVLLSAMALQRVGFGLLLIVAFSLGLASVLTAIGILMVHAGRLFERIPTRGRVFQVIPVASSLLIALAGVGITLQALTQTGVLKGIAVAFAGPF
ncbi:MAG TPA: sulfite exporter TauE/SafE family protein [Ardenticatenaceae bacterium]